MVITYPLLTVVDDAGAIVSGATVAITSVKDKAGVDIVTPGATISQSGANVSVDYDAELKGDAWIVLAISKAGNTFTGLNTAPAFFLARDPSRVLSGISATGKVTPADASITTAAIADGAITSAKFTVAAISGVASGILEKLDQLWRRFFKPASRTPTQIKTLADNGTTVLTTQAITDDLAGNETQGGAT